MIFQLLDLVKNLPDFRIRTFPMIAFTCYVLDEGLFSHVRCYPPLSNLFSSVAFLKYFITCLVYLFYLTLLFIFVSGISCDAVKLVLDKRYMHLFKLYFFSVSGIADHVETCCGRFVLRWIVLYLFNHGLEHGI